MTAALEGGEWSAAGPSRIFHPGKTRYTFYKRLGGAQGRSGQAEILVPTRIRSQTFQPVVSRYTDWAIRPTVKTTIDQKQLENVESFKYLGSMLTNDGRCTCEIKSRITMAKVAFNKKRVLFTSTLELELGKKLVKCYIWSIALYGAETWTLRLVDQKHLESFEMLCWRSMEKINWTDHVRNEEVLLRVKEQRNILDEISKRKADWIGHIFVETAFYNGL